MTCTKIQKNLPQKWSELGHSTLLYSIRIQRDSFWFMPLDYTFWHCFKPIADYVKPIAENSRNYSVIIYSTVSAPSMMNFGY